MATIQGRDRNDVHECQDDREERRLHPEGTPVPSSREEVGDRAKTTQAGGTLLGEDILHITYVALQRLDTQFDTSWHTGDEAIRAMLHLIQLRGKHHHHTQLASRIGLQRQLLTQSRTVEIQCDRLVLMRC